MRYFNVQGGNVPFMFIGRLFISLFFILIVACSPKLAKLPSTPFPSYEPPPFKELPPEEPPKKEEPVLPIEEKKVEPILEREEKFVPKIEPPVIPVLLPDAAVTDLLLNAKRKLVVLLSNLGEGPLPIGSGALKILIDGQLKGVYPLSSLSDQSMLYPKEILTFTTPLTIIGRHQVHARLDLSPETFELDQENNDLKKMMEGPPIGPDIVVKDMDLTEDLDLSILLANGGEVDLRKGVTFRIRIFVNDRKVSEFDHYITDVLKAKLANQYTIEPPYRVGISGISKVRIHISPKLSSDDVRLENNFLERVYILFPFKIGPQAKEEFSFSVAPFRSQAGFQTGKVKVEARWTGGGAPLALSFDGSSLTRHFPAISGKEPLKVEFPISLEEHQRGSL
jgi:hypothetical protein